RRGTTASPAAARASPTSPLPPQKALPLRGLANRRRFGVEHPPSSDRLTAPLHPHLSRGQRVGRPNHAPPTPCFPPPGRAPNRGPCGNSEGASYASVRHRSRSAARPHPHRVRRLEARGQHGVWGHRELRDEQQLSSGTVLPTGRPTGRLSPGRLPLV